MLLELMTALGLIAGFTNVGSCGNATTSPLTDGNLQVRRNVYDRCEQVFEKYGRLDHVGLLETMTYNFKLAPRFGLPCATDADVDIRVDGVSKTRGVCVYSNDALAVPQPEGNMVEGTVTIQQYADRNGRNRLVTTKVAMITVYNLGIGPNLNGIKQYISMQRAKVRQAPYNCRHSVIMGDFNNEMATIMGLREITHEDGFHKANPGTSKRFIDKIFTDLPANECKILECLPTCENKEGTEEDKLGHKFFVIAVGKYKRTKEEVMTRTCFQLLKRNLKDIDDDGGIKACHLDTEKKIADVNDLLLNHLCAVKDASQTKRHSNPGNKSALKAIETMSDKGLRSPNASKAFSRLYETFKHINGGANHEERPNLEAFCKHSKEKGDNLNIPDDDRTLAAVKELFVEEEVVKVKTVFLTKKAFRKECIMKLSNSGAKDFYGLSVKFIKYAMKYSKAIFNLMYEMCKACANQGFVPKALKIDCIHYLYKNKGSRGMAASYRPITLAPSLGKILERCISNQLAWVDDKNPDNNAYISQKSCQSAILEISEALRDYRTSDAAKLAAERGDIVIPVLFLEDVKSAYESIASKALELIMDILYDENGDFKMAKIIKSYMNRTTFIVEKDVLREVCRKHIERSAPQGSILSPTFWRFFDGLFTILFKNGLEQMISTCDYIRAYKHVSFADDHKILMVLAFPKGTSPSEIKQKIRTTTITTRTLLDLSTRDLGCGINYKKSEVILPEEYADKELASESEYVWLGYSIKLKLNLYLEFSDTQIKKRFESSRKRLREMFQYTTDIRVRFRIWRIFIAPLIEWFMICMLTEPRQVNSGTNMLEKFQRDVLCMVTNACVNVNRLELEDVCGEKHVSEKLKIMAERLNMFIRVRDLEFLKFGEARMSTQISTRSQTILFPWSGADNLDFGDQITMLITGDSAMADVDSSHNGDDDSDNESDEDSDSDDEEDTRRPDFNRVDVQRWVRNANGVISRKMQERIRADEYTRVSITRSNGHSAL